MTGPQQVELDRLAAMPDHDLTFAAENCTDVEILLVLASHRSRLVREGVMYGLAKQLSGPSHATTDCLRRAAESDESPGVREAAAEALEPWMGWR